MKKTGGGGTGGSGGSSFERARAPLRGGPFPYPELPFPVARRSPDIVGFRDGDADSRLGCAGRDEIGAAADRVCLAQLFGPPDPPDVWGDRRPHPPPPPSPPPPPPLCRP